MKVERHSKIVELIGKYEIETQEELAQKLNLNSGTVFRDLNSLYNARLLLVESGSGRNCYRLNLPVIRQIVDHVLHYLGDHT